MQTENYVKEAELTEGSSFFGKTIVKSINIFFIVASGILIIYILSTLLISDSRKELTQPESMTEETSDTEPMISFSAPAEFSQYSEVINKRNIFDQEVLVSGEVHEVSTVNSSPDDISRFTQFKLLGTVIDQNPIAIISNTQNQETLFLHRGDNLLEGTVNEIKDGEITVLYQNRPIEITQE